MEVEGAPPSGRKWNGLMMQDDAMVDGRMSIGRDEEVLFVWWW
jgi:hypothetical protein